MIAQPHSPSTFLPIEARAFGDIRAWIGAHGGESFDARPFGRISTDSRGISPGEVFLALKGENFDGHVYAAGAVDHGAAGLIVDHSFGADLDSRVPVLRVPDPLFAYGEIAARIRRDWGGRLVALSGSVGKTTTRRLLAHGLRRHVALLEPFKNFNNLIGLPHTLLRLEPAHELVVAELGINQPGELDRLTDIAAPDVAGLTRLGPAHVGMFGSMEALIEAKFAIFQRAPAHAVFVLNAECPYSRGAISRFGGDHRFVTFRGEGDAAADYRIENAAPLASGGYRFDLRWHDGAVDGLYIDAFGRHLLEDIAAAAAMAAAAGYDPACVVESLADFRTEPMRGQIIQAGDWTLILDCYNAAPSAMMSALRSLGELPGERRLVLVLADMLELGDFAESLHDRLIEPLRRLRPVLVLSLGEQFARISPRLRDAGIDAEALADRDALVAALRARLLPGDRIFLKGSRRFELEEVARALAGPIPGWEGAL